MLRIASLWICLFTTLTVPGSAQDWVADRLRGDVQQMVSGQWLDLVRGAVVLSGNQVRTGQNSRVSLVRGAEVLELGPGTQSRLHEGSGKRTSIVLATGMVTADVERRNVQQLSANTQYLAAIVKVTRFRVTGK